MTRRRPLVVGYDGSAASAAAVDHAAATAAGRPVVIVHAYREPDESLAQSVLDAVLLEGHDGLADVEWEARAVHGGAAQAILEVADDVGADAIVVGSHGRGAIGALLGSVSRDLLTRSTRPVTVIPPRCAAKRSALRTG
jgi:nucleotide-binding universal stress UspA family protein